MISELLLTVFSAFGAMNIQDFKLDSCDYELIESNPYFLTYKTNNKSYLSFYKTNYGLEDEILLDGSPHNYRSIINNKYFISGENTSYNSNPLYVDKSPIQHPYLSSVDYKTIFEIDLSLFPVSFSILNAGLLLYKRSGNLTNLHSYKVTNDPVFTDITGITILSTTYLSTSVSTNNVYDINLTDSIIDSIDDEKTAFVILLEGHTNNSVDCLYSNSDQNYSPVFYVEYSFYGNACPFYNVSSSSIDCLDYVLYDYNGGNDINVALMNAFGNSIINYYSLSIIGFSVISNKFGNNSVRVLSSYDSFIYANERRIAFKVAISPNFRYGGDYHFMCQCENGTWGHKLGPLDSSENLLTEDAPELYSNWFYNNSCNPTLYFAYAS